jgi:hypothetical protein
VGLEVVVVNGKHEKNLPGRKTDLSDAEWLATLHAHLGIRKSADKTPRLAHNKRLRSPHHLLIP